MKKIIIIGGGISGLSTLFFLKKKYAAREDVDIQLLEKNPHAGGTVHSRLLDGLVFEGGVNGFIDSHDTTRELIAGLNLQGDLIDASRESKGRYICVHRQLHALPQGLGAVFSFKLLSVMDKLRLPLEIFVAKGLDAEESVYDFAARRFGDNVAKYLFDPMVSGIYAGDARRISVKAAFPKLYDLEQKHGSVFKGLLRGMRAAKKESKSAFDKKEKNSLGGRLRSFRKGMAQLTDTIAQKYALNMSLNTEVTRVEFKENSFLVHSPTRVLSADEIFVCVPAFVAADILKPLSADLSMALDKIPYAPVAVVGLVYASKDVQGKLPPGFGYLIPSSERQECLGVLFETQVFPTRNQGDRVLIRVLLGGYRHPTIVKKHESELMIMAQKELKTVLNIETPALQHSVVMWPRAIPQYMMDYLTNKITIDRELQNFLGLHLVANYWGGVSLNDCVANAHAAAGASLERTNA